MATSAPQRAESVSFLSAARRAGPGNNKEYRPGVRSLNFGADADKEGDNMKPRILKCMIAMTLLAATAMPVPLAAQSKYHVVELGELGGTAGSANGINNRGWVTGSDNLAGDATSVATLWLHGSTIPLGTL